LLHINLVGVIFLFFEQSGDQSIDDVISMKRK